MATFQKRSNRWRAIIRKKGQPVTSRSFRTKGLAQAWAKKVEDDIDSGAYDEQARLRACTLQGICDAHLAHLERTSSRGRRVLSDYRMLLAGLGADTPVGELSYPLLAEFCRTRLDVDEVLPSTTKANIMFLSGAINTGVLELELPSVLKDQMGVWRDGLTRAGLIASPRRRDRRPTASELDLLLTHVQHNKALRSIDYGCLVRFAVASCMRLGEITRLQWRDYDPGKATVVIRDRKHPTGKAGNHQEIPLMGEAQAIIEAQPRVGERIFPFNEEPVSNGFRRITQSLGIFDLRFHDLRHEGISRLFERGYGIEEVAMVSGHRDWGSLKRYVNLRPADLAAKDRTGRE